MILRHDVLTINKTPHFHAIGRQTLTEHEEIIYWMKRKHFCLIFRAKRNEAIVFIISYSSELKLLTILTLLFGIKLEKSIQNVDSKRDR